MPPPAPSSALPGRIHGFSFIKFLGKGTFGAVYQARREEDNKIYAIKKVDTRRMTSKERAEAVNEIRVLASINGANVITFFEAFVEADILYIVTEFANHGDLFAFLKTARRRGQLAETTVWQLFIQMCLGVQCLHAKNILHRDLKAANVFMCSSNYIKLGDFGVSKVLKSSEALARTQVGTPYYVSPEVWRNRPYNSKCDMWSLGCLLYELCTYRPPFEAESMEGLARKIMRGKFEPIPAGYSRALHAMVGRLLVTDPARRASVDEVLCSEEVVRRMSDLPKFPGPNDSPADAAPFDIVKTIQVPRRFNDLTANLPPSRYDTPLIGGPPPAVPPHKQPCQPASDALNAVREGPSADEARWNKKERQTSAQHQRVAPSAAPAPAAAKQAAAAPSLPPLTPQQQHKLQQRKLEERRKQHQQAMAAQHQAVTRLNAPKLPHVPGAQGPPSSAGSEALVDPAARQIRVVYHNQAYPYKAAPGASKQDSYSIFRSGSNSSYYNPITHQHMSRYYQPGSYYHSRNQPHHQPPQSRLSQLHSAAQAYGGAQRHRPGRL